MKLCKMRQHICRQCKLKPETGVVPLACCKSAVVFFLNLEAPAYRLQFVQEMNLF